MGLTRKIIITAIAALLCAALALAQDTNPQATINSLEKSVTAGTATHDQQLELARAYIQVGRYYEASQIAAAVAQADPSDTAAVAVADAAKKGLRDLAQEKLAAAQANANRAGATDEDRLALADAYFSAGDYGMAADLYAKLPPSMVSSDTQLRRARALAWSGQLDAAERAYSDLLKNNSTPDVQVEYGRTLSWMGASRAAVDTLKSAYAQSPTEPAAVALANAQAWSGDRQSAIALLTDFTASHPNAAQAQNLLAEMRTSPDLRIEQIDRQIAAEPFNLALRAERARLLYDAGRYAEALSTIRFIHQNTRQDIAGLDELQKNAETRRQEEIAKLDERRKSLEATTMTSSSGSGDAGQILDLAKAYTALGAYDQSIALYQRYLSLRPDDTTARINYARVLSWDRRYSSAAREYRQLLAQMPDRADLRYEYAQTLSYQSDYVDAIQTLRGLTDVSSNPRARLYSDVPQKAYFSLGQIYRWYGWNDTAIEEQNRALALDPTYGPAREELTMARYRRPASNFGATYGFAEDSSDFRFRRVDLDGQVWTSPRFAWEGSVGRHNFDWRGDSASANVVSGGARYRASDQYTARARVGANFYDQNLGTRPFWGAGVDWLPNIQTRTSLDYNHYDLVYDVFNIGALTPVSPVPTRAGSPLDIDDLRGRFDYNPGGFWSGLADASYGRVSDSNKRSAAHGLIAFRVLKSPFVAVKADGRYLSYDFRTPRYWSPTSYHSLAGVLQIGSNVRDRFFWSVEGKAGKAWEQSRTSDLRSIAATITVPVSDVFDVVGAYGYGKSGRFDSVIGDTPTDFTNYWQRNFYVGIRLKRLFSSADARRPQDRYYYDSSVLSGSPVLPPVGETH